MATTPKLPESLSDRYSFWEFSYPPTNCIATPGGASRTSARPTIYDFGDNWQHRVKVEKILPPDSDLRSPICLAGRNACPPEDVGGGPGYIEFLEAITDPSHEDHEQLLEWCGGSFDPDAFDLAAVNERLSEFEF
ncbi:plasmid pRiA4b ORF-3 family protein [Paraburkholderia ginsengisoli]|uniref:plasmid pRiA4b ORF-3 family protein n=1 Tax=Paraburkholderia ginsengisoli TaxID=311231 RepID=UPI001E3B9FB1|nr:plasmid pRiA4b ORF-3 family protein [Paraburkholderia ginsengisoli]